MHHDISGLCGSFDLAAVFVKPACPLTCSKEGHEDAHHADEEVSPAEEEDR